MDAHSELAPPQSFTKRWLAKAEECGRRTTAHAKDVTARYKRHTRHFPRSNVGQHVRIQDPISHRWDKVMIIMDIGKSRDYEVHLAWGHVYWREGGDRCIWIILGTYV